MEWYYQSGAAASGPVDEATFRALIANGTIRRDTLVWRNGMAAWQPLEVAAPEYIASAGAQTSQSRPAQPVPTVFVSSGPHATFAELKECAKTGPQGNYWTFVGAFVLWQIILSALGGTILVVGAIIFTGIYQYGMSNLGLRGADHRQLAIGDAFIGFQQFGRAFGYYFLTTLFIILWSLLFIIPGIIKAFSYMLTPYIMLDRPEISITGAIDESRRLMDGNKWRAFCLGLSFIGWWLLGILTCGILWFWVIPYQSITMGAFYRAILREKGVAPASASAV